MLEGVRLSLISEPGKIQNVEVTYLAISCCLTSMQNDHGAVFELICFVVQASAELFFC